MERSVYIIQCPPSWIKTAPLSLVYLENYLKDRKIRVKVQDLNIDLFRLSKLSPKEWLTLNDGFEKGLFSQIEKIFPSYLSDFYESIKDYDTIAFSLLKRNSYFSFSLAGKVKEKFPEKRIIFGGPHTLFLEYKNELDSQNFWVIGEGESAMLKILNGSAEKLQHFEELENLDNLSFLDFNCLDIKNYSSAIPLLSSRGCKFSCNFCSERKLYKKFRQHSPEYICESMNQLTQRYKTNTFVFCDSLINYSNEWLEKFCSLVTENKLNVKWEAQMRIDERFDIALGKLMKKSGCYNLFVGMESASDSVLKNMNKGFNSKVARDFFEKAVKSGLLFEISLIFGYPGETEANFEETLNFIAKNKNIIPKIAQANPFIDYMGDFSNDVYPSQEAKSRIFKFIKMLELEKIRYTKSFINNLTY